jgi:hypothetical protein
MTEEILQRTKELLQEQEAVQLIHKYFSADCFNRCWDMIDMPTRSEEQREDMLLLAGASLWHWKQRGDCLPENLSVAYWQMGRVYVLAGRAEMAREWAKKCLEISIGKKLPPFYLGYAYEVMADSAFLSGDGDASEEHLRAATEQASMVEDDESRSYLKADLEALRKRMGKSVE